MLQNRRFIVVLAISLIGVAIYNISYFMKRESGTTVYAEAGREATGMVATSGGDSDVTTDSGGMMEYNGATMTPESMTGGSEEPASGKGVNHVARPATLDDITVPANAHFEREAPPLQGKSERNPFLTGWEHRQTLMRSRNGGGRRAMLNRVTGKMIKMIYVLNDIGHVVVGDRLYKVGDSVGGEVIVAIKDESLILSSGGRRREIFIGSRSGGKRG